MSTSDLTPEGPHPHPPLGWLRRTIREFGLTLITAGVVILLFVAYQLWGTSIAEQHSQSQLASQFRQAVAANHTGTTATSTAPPTTTPPTTAAAATPTTTVPLPTIPSGDAIDHLVIPAIGVDKYVVEGTADADLQRGPGHYTGTPYPGQDGNVAIAGHRTTYGAPFFDLDKVKVGDPIYLTDLTGTTWTYDVSASPRVVSPDDVSVLDPTTFPELTLTTCNPRFSATSRLVVVARLAGKAVPVNVTHAPGSAGSPAKAIVPLQSLPGADRPANDNLGGGSSRAWLPVGLYGAAVLALWVLTRLVVNRTRRWRRAGAFVLGIAVCLVPLWFLYENVARLLPQNI